MHPRRIAHIGPPRPDLEPIWAGLSKKGVLTEVGLSLAAGLQRVQQGLDALLLDPALPGRQREGLLEESLRCDSRLAVVALLDAPDLADAVRLGRIGLADAVVTPTDPSDAAEVLFDRLGRLWSVAAEPARKLSQDSFAGLVGHSSGLRRVIDVARMIAPRSSTVLIQGPTGAGKELLARAIHEASPRVAGPWVAVNCGAVPAELIESEFFGHVKGSFTGATATRAGRFEQADGGTILLDEVGETPPEMQAKLLRVLQEREIQPVGGSETISVDIRVIAATNCDLAEMVRQGKFREDLYYRLNVVPIELPGLAERIEDLPDLVERLLDKVCRRERMQPKRCSPEALDRLMQHAWPGNVRELENAVEKAVALSGDRAQLFPSDFPLPPAVLAHARSPLTPEVDLPAGGLNYDAFVHGVELNLMQQALERAGGNKKRAADLLRIKRTTFAARWKALQEAV